MSIFDKSIELSFALFNAGSELRSQHFSFIFFKSKLLVIGQNSKKTHPINLLNPRLGKTGKSISEIKGSCSELNAFIQLRNLTNIPYNKCILINTRIDRNKKLNLAKPCLSCFSLIDYIGPKAVFYTNNLGEFEVFEK